MSTSTRRTELADFLRTRRERITPEEVGLPGGGRRRTPGLRREEVALLAGVGVTWYTWLEQGRDINASMQVLEAIARTLRMDNQERWHLLQLAGLGVAPPAAECAGIGPAGAAILDQLDPFPAAVLSRRYDIIGYNRGYNALCGDLDAVDPVERNQVWLFFVNPYWQGLCVRRDEAAQHLVGSLRASMAGHLDDPLWIAFVERLLAASEEFAELWKRHDVVEHALPLKDFTSPVGDLRLSSTKLAVGGSGTSRMVVYSPRDEETRARLDRLVAYVAARRLEAV